MITIGDRRLSGFIDNLWTISDLWYLLERHKFVPSNPVTVDLINASGADVQDSFRDPDRTSTVLIAYFNNTCSLMLGTLIEQLEIEISIRVYLG